MDDSSVFGYNFNLNDCSFSFIIKVYPILDTVINVLQSTTLDNSELIYD